MDGKAGMTTGLALLAAGMAWAGGVQGGEGNRGLSLIISTIIFISTLGRQAMFQSILVLPTLKLT